LFPAFIILKIKKSPAVVGCGNPGPGTFYILILPNNAKYVNARENAYISLTDIARFKNIDFKFYNSLFPRRSLSQRTPPLQRRQSPLFSLRRLVQKERLRRGETTLKAQLLMVFVKLSTGRVVDGDSGDDRISV